MQRTRRQGAVAQQPALAPPDAAPGFYSPGDPATATPATIVGADEANMIQEELVQAVLAAGLALDEGDNTQLAQAIARFAAPSGSALSGLVSGRIERTSATVVSILPGVDGLIRVHRAGGLGIAAAQIDFDITADRMADTPAENPGTFYYLYLDANLTPGLSETPPVLPQDGGNVGYHPTIAGQRYITAVYNDASSDLLAAEWIQPGDVLIHALLPGVGAGSLGLTGPTVWTETPPLPVPETARVARVQTLVEARQHQWHLGHPSLAGSATGSGTVISRLTWTPDPTGLPGLDAFQFRAWGEVGVAPTSGPAMRCAHKYVVAPTNLLDNSIGITGWRE